MYDSNKISFLIVDTQSVVRQGLRSIIKSNYPFADIYCADTICKAEESIKNNSISFLIIDVQCCNGDAKAFLNRTMELTVKPKVLVFTNLTESHYILSLIKAGISGFLGKKSQLAEIKLALDEIMFKGKYFSQHIQEKMLNNYISQDETLNAFEDLSEREIEITRLLAHGKANSEISEILSIRQNTVSTIKKRIFKKVGIDNLVELVSFYKNYSGASSSMY
ncbi:LuxR C-terminal-related transcriptional regulator [Flavobacterium sp.]|uniref:LuxR C-terminal-related transcriptional regulator n=1 Tax=Flavobacterium sp. TaxID=239 RepID=UPI00352758D3